MGYRTVVSLILLLSGCLEPFPTDRHDLVELRIAGMTVEADGALRALVWEGSEAFSDVVPERTWGGDASCAEGACALTAPGTATLTVTGADGATESGELTLFEGATAPVLGAYTRTAGEDGGSLSLEVDGAERVHFMAPAGEFEESAFAATTYTAPGVGVWPVVALWLGGLGANGWATFDIPVGVDGPFLAVGTRLFPLDASLPVGPVTVSATLVEGGDPSGIRLTEVVVDDPTPPDSVCGTTDGLWDPDSLIERLCGRDEVLGARVRIAGEVQP